MFDFKQSDFVIAREVDLANHRITNDGVFHLEFETMHRKVQWSVYWLPLLYSSIGFFVYARDQREICHLHYLIGKLK